MHLLFITETMTFAQFRHNFLANEYHLSRYKNATFSALVVALCIAISHALEMGIMAGAFIIGAQSVTGINRQGAFRIRFGIASKTAVILSLSAVLGAAAGSSLALSIIAGIILAFSFAWWRQMFPFNWPDVVIPSAVLFFMSYVDPAIPHTAAGAALGWICEVGLGIVIYIKRYVQHVGRLTPLTEQVTPPQKEDVVIWGLKKYLWTYAVELSALLTLSFVFIRYTHFPHGYWLPLTIIIVLKVGRHGTLRRVTERTLGTLAGCVLGGLILYLQLPLIVNYATMVICIFVWLCFLRYQYAVGTIFITTFVLLLLGSYLPFSIELAVERAAFTVAAGILTLLSSLIFLGKERR